MYEPRDVGLGCGLSIVASIVAFTIPEVITLVLHPVFQRAAVDEALGSSRTLTVLQQRKAQLVVQSCFPK